MTIGGGFEWMASGSLAVLKAGLLFGSVLLLCKSAARRSPTVRHGLWTLVIAGAFVSLVPLGAGPSLVVEMPGQHALSATPVTVGATDASRASNAVDAGAVPGTNAGSRFAVDPGSAVLLVWGIVAAILLARLVRAHASLRRFHRSGTIDADERLVARVDAIARQLGMRQRPRVRVSRGATAPHVSGVVRPTIVLPASQCTWPAATLEAILRHELAHVRRQDCLWNTLTNVACAVAWFNPFLHAARRRQRYEAERCCDDAVLAGGVCASVYLESLVLVSRSTQAVASVGLASMALPRRDLLRRAKRIASASDTPLTHSRVRGWASLFVFGIVLLVTMSVSVARVASVASPAGGGDRDEPDAVRLERVLREADAGRVDARWIVEESARLRADAARQETLLRALASDEVLERVTLSRFVEVAADLRADAAVEEVFDALLRQVRLPEPLAIRVVDRAVSMNADAAKEHVLLSLVRSQTMTPAVRSAASRAARTITIDASRSRVETAISRA